MSNIRIHGRWEDNLPTKDISLIIADPVYRTQSVHDVVAMVKLTGIPSVVFMDVLDLLDLEHKPSQICHWIKPISTKNTAKNYSRFAEAICLYGVRFYKPTHWANRTGIFTDVLLSNDEHPWKKPESLIERLICNHYPGHGAIYDPCAGSFTVDTVCRRRGVPSISIECEQQYHEPKGEKP